MVAFLAEAHMPSQLYGHCRGDLAECLEHHSTRCGPLLPPAVLVSRFLADTAMWHPSQRPSAWETPLLPSVRPSGLALSTHRASSVPPSRCVGSPAQIRAVIGGETAVLATILVSFERHLRTSLRQSAQINSSLFPCLTQLSPLLRRRTPSTRRKRPGRPSWRHRRGPWRRPVRSPPKHLLRSSSPSHPGFASLRRHPSCPSPVGDHRASSSGRRFPLPRLAWAPAKRLTKLCGTTLERGGAPRQAQ